MFRITLEVLNASFVPESVDGGPPDTLVEVSLLPSAQDAHPIKKETGMCYRSREPKWGDRFDFGPCTQNEVLLIRLLERPGDTKVERRVLGTHTLTIGGLHRQFGCAWIALKENCLLTEASVPIPDTPCLRVVWTLGPDEEFTARDATDAAATAMRHATITTLRAATNRTVLSPSSPSPSKRRAPADAEGVAGADVDHVDEKEHSMKVSLEWKQRVERLEERIDHLDSLFRTRRDYEAEVQRIMIVNAEKRAKEEKEMAYAGGGDGYASLATTPSAAIALIHDQQKADIMRTVQPAHMSVAATTSPWNMFQKPSLTTLPPSVASHFPLKWKGAEGHGSALQSILLQPTRVTSQDTQLLDSSTYQPVTLPKPRWIGFIPAPVLPPQNPLLTSLKPLSVSS
jgi:hypothetical protein